MSYRTDPDWLEAQADLIGAHPGLSASERLAIAVTAINRMFLIEQGHPEAAALLRAGGASA